MIRLWPRRPDWKPPDGEDVCAFCGQGFWPSSEKTTLAGLCAHESCLALIRRMARSIIDGWYVDGRGEILMLVGAAFVTWEYGTNPLIVKRDITKLARLDDGERAAFASLHYNEDDYTLLFFRLIQQMQHDRTFRDATGIKTR